MNKRICSLLVAIIIASGFGSVCKAEENLGDNDSSFINIFTPRHNMKSVFAPSNSPESVTAYINKETGVTLYELTEDEIELIAKVVYAESKGEPFEGKVAVASVIFNRLSHPEFPKTVKDVIYERNAFSCLDERHMDIVPDIDAYKAVDEALNGNDPTDDAVFFYNPSIATSKWMKDTSKNRAKIIGRHVFFK